MSQSEPNSRTMSSRTRAVLTIPIVFVPILLTGCFLEVHVYPDGSAGVLAQGIGSGPTEVEAQKAAWNMLRDELSHLGIDPGCGKYRAPVSERKVDNKDPSTAWSAHISWVAQDTSRKLLEDRLSGKITSPSPGILRIDFAEVKWTGRIRFHAPGRPASCATDLKVSTTPDGRLTHERIVLDPAERKGIWFAFRPPASGLSGVAEDPIWTELFRCPTWTPSFPLDARGRATTQRDLELERETRDARIKEVEQSLVTVMERCESELERGQPLLVILRIRQATEPLTCLDREFVARNQALLTKAVTLLARARMAVKQHRGALTDLDRFRALCPTVAAPAYWHVRGQVLEALGRDDEARECYERSR